MIITTDEPLRVGEVYGNTLGDTVTDGDGKEHKIVFLVLRTASIQEFELQCINQGKQEHLYEHYADYADRNFYHVAMD